MYSLQSVGPGADPGVPAVSPQVTISHPPGGRLRLLSARPAVTFPAAEHHRPFACTMLYCLVTAAYMREQLAQCYYAALPPSRIWTHDLLIASPTHYPLCHRAAQNRTWQKIRNTSDARPQHAKEIPHVVKQIYTNVRPPYCRAEMYAGHVAWWVTVSMPTGQTDRQTDGRQTLRLSVWMRPS